MNIGIDARLLERKMTGIGRFLKTFLNELPLIDKHNKYFLFTYESIDVYDEFYTIIKTIKSFLPQKFFSPIWSNFILPGYLKKNKIDLFFSANQILPLIKIKDIKYILVLHDVIYKVDNSFHPFIYRKYLQFFTYFSIRSSDIIITVSEYSKQDIIKYYSVEENKIKVVYEAVDEDFKILNLTDDEKRDIKENLNLPEHIVLYVGVIENRKNIKGILKIADEVYKIDRNIKFVLIGKIGYGGKNLLKELTTRENVVYLGNVQDELLKKIYNISSVFLFPSLYEGFGFPPLEAMNCGLPVLSSNNTALKEVIGSGGVLHAPDDYNSFVQDIFKLIGDKNFHREVSNSGIERAKIFNINRTAKELVNIFNEL